MKCDIKVQSLVDTVLSQSVEHLSPDHWRLVKKSFSKISRSIGKLYDKNIIGQPYLNQVEKILLPVKEWLKKNKQNTYAKPLEEKEWQKINNIVEPNSAIPEEVKIVEKEPIAALTQKKSIALQSFNFNFLTESFKKLGAAKPEAFKTELDTMLALCSKGWKKVEDSALQIGLLHYLSKLPMYKTFWDKIGAKDKNEIKVVIANLGQLAHTLFKTCFTVPQAQIVHTDRIYALLKILYIQDMLVRRVEPKLDLAYDYRNIFSDKDLFFTIFDGKKSQEMNTLIDWFKNKYSHHKCQLAEQFQYHHFMPVGQSTALTYVQHTKETFADLLKKIDPDAIQEIKKQIPNFGALPKFKQDARIYASPLLPDWIKSLRDTHLLSHESLFRTCSQADDL